MHKLRYCAATLAGAACIAFAMGSTAGADVGVDSGGAAGVQADVDTLAGPVNIPPTPSVNTPPGGGSAQQSVTNLSVPGVASASVLSATTDGTVGPGGSVSSSADVVDASAGDDVVTADVIHSECLSDESGSSGSSSLVDASVAGNPVAVSPPPNTTIPVPSVGTVTLNEQQTSDGPASTGIVVNAVHVALDGPAATGDVIISQSRCGVAGSSVLGGPTSQLPEAAAAAAEAAAAGGINANPNLAG
jgi:hypothetical protein